MSNDSPTAFLFADNVDDLAKQLIVFRKNNRLPPLPAGELFIHLYNMEPRRIELCDWVSHFIVAHRAAEKAAKGVPPATNTPSDATICTNPAQKRQEGGSNA